MKARRWEIGWLGCHVISNAPKNCYLRVLILNRDDIALAAGEPGLGHLGRWAAGGQGLLSGCVALFELRRVCECFCCTTVVAQVMRPKIVTAPTLL